MSAGEREQLVGAIARALEPLAGVRAALLFGSHARGRARPESDVDVAVLLDARAAPEDPHSRLQRLLAALAAELAADRIDLVILNEAPPALAFQVLKHGIVALNRDPIALHRFRVHTYDLHADFEPVERLFRERTRRRLLGGSAGG